MRFNCCDYLLHHLVFEKEIVLPCCNTKDSSLYFSNYQGELIDISEYEEKRKYCIDLLKNGEIPSSCRNCNLLEEKEYDESLIINRITIAHHSKCLSCNCIYCISTEGNDKLKKEFNSKKTYDIKPVLADLRNKNLIANRTEIIIGGGECSEYPKGELEWLMYFASSLDCRVTLLSSGITFSKCIENVLKSQRASLIISPDAGQKQTYEKIKRVKAFDKVWDNIKKYVAASKDNKESIVQAKYIIVPGINDNIEEAEAFIQKCISVGCEHIMIDIERLGYDKDSSILKEQSIKNTICYFGQIKELNLSFARETEHLLKVS